MKFRRVQAGRACLPVWVTKSLFVSLIVTGMFGISGCQSTPEPVNTNSANNAKQATPLKMGGPAGLFYIDFVNGKPVTPDNLVIIPADVKEVVISGWAADYNSKKPAAGVLINIDGKKDVPAEYGLERRDVATYLKDNSYTSVGFRASIPTSTIDKGTHTISFKVISADNTQYFVPDRKFALAVQ